MGMSDEKYIADRDAAKRGYRKRLVPQDSPEMQIERKLNHLADWSRKFTAEEILNSDEVKNLIAAVDHFQNATLYTREETTEAEKKIFESFAAFSELKKKYGVEE